MTAIPMFADDRIAAIEELHTATALYTVEPVVRDLFSRITWPHAGRRLIDPSCGDGAFLTIALELLLAADPSIGDDALVDAVQGWEIHAGACASARASIATVLSAHGRDPRLSAAIVHEGDFLIDPTVSTQRQYDVVIGNPPYLRYCNVPALLRLDYEGAIAEWARHDLLHSFLNRCAEFLTPAGELAMVTADRWLFNMSCARLRGVLGKTLGVRHLTRLDASTAFTRPKMRRRGAPPRIHPVAVVLSPNAGAQLGEAPMYPESVDVAGGVPLGSIARVRIAPWVGPLGVFLLDKKMAARLDGAPMVPVIDTDDLLPDGTMREASRFVLLTDPATQPGDDVCAHIERNAHLLPARARTRKGAWWVPPERIDAIDTTRPMLVIPRIVRELKAYIAPAGVVAINHNLTVIPDNGSLVALREALESEDTRAWIRSRAPRLEGGFLSVTTKLLRDLPICLERCCGAGSFLPRQN